MNPPPRRPFVVVPEPSSAAESAAAADATGVHYVVLFHGVRLGPSFPTAADALRYANWLLDHGAAATGG